MNTCALFENSRMKVERDQFARLCVEIDLQKKLVPRIICASALFNVKYEGLGLICFACGRYGHRKEACPWKMSSGGGEVETGLQNSQSSVPKAVPEKKFPAKKEAFGPWMFARKPVKTQNPRTMMDKGRGGDWISRRMSNLAGEPDVTASRFAAIADHVDQNGENGSELQGLGDGSEAVEEWGKAEHCHGDYQGSDRRGLNEIGPSSNIGRRADKKNNGRNDALGKKKIQPIVLNGGPLGKSEAKVHVGNSKQGKLGQRAHRVVSGSMGVSEPILIVGDERESSGKKVVLLEGSIGESSWDIQGIVQSNSRMENNGLEYYSEQVGSDDAYRESEKPATHKHEKGDKKEILWHGARPPEEKKYNCFPPV